MDQEQLEEMLGKCLSELKLAADGKCNGDRADKNAALFLEVQINLSDYVSTAELKVKMAKNELERLSGQKYFEYKNGLPATIPADKNRTGSIIAFGKMTEAGLEQALCQDKEIAELKGEISKAEAEHKKWNYLLSTLSNGHIYYRNLGRKEI